MNKYEIQSKIEKLTCEIASKTNEIANLEKQLKEIIFPKHGDVVRCGNNGSDTNWIRIITNEDGKWFARSLDGRVQSNRTDPKELDSWYRECEYTVLYNVFDRGFN